MMKVMQKANQMEGHTGAGGGGMGQPGMGGMGMGY